MDSFKPEITLVSEDARGEIYSISLPGDRELMLLHSKAGTLRGGHSHDVPEANMVLAGRMDYQKRDADGNEHAELLVAGEFSRNEAGQIHMAYFPEDTYMVEWKICKDKHSWKNENYAPWREKVVAGVK